MTSVDDSILIITNRAEIDSLREEIDALKEQNALLTVQVPEGWKLVPVEPTADMIIAAGDGYETGEVIGPASCYRVMLDAAPALPQQVKSEDAMDAAQGIKIVPDQSIPPDMMVIRVGGEIVGAVVGISAQD